MPHIPENVWAGAFLLLSAVAVGWQLRKSVKRGRFDFEDGPRVDRVENPAGFWFNTALLGVIAFGSLICAVLALLGY